MFINQLMEILHDDQQIVIHDTKEDKTLVRDSVSNLKNNNLIKSLEIKKMGSEQGEIVIDI